MSPACEGVLELLWNLPDGVEFRSDPLPKKEQKILTVPEGKSGISFASGRARARASHAARSISPSANSRRAKPVSRIRCGNGRRRS